MPTFFPDIMVFTDGTVDKNSTKAFSKGAGCAVVLLSRKDDRGVPRIFSLRTYTKYEEGIEEVTNNRMELLGFLVLADAAQNIPQTDDIIYIWADSEWAINSLFNPEWRIKKNLDLIEKIRDQFRNSPFRIYTQHIKGHAGHFLNELTDYAAMRSRQTQKNLDVEVPAAVSDSRCLVCSRFPCKGGIKLRLSPWTQVFAPLKKVRYEACTNLDPYINLESVEIVT